MKTRTILTALTLGLAALSALHAQTIQSPTTVLFQNVLVFDGKSDKLTAPMNVLVRGNIIETISDKPIPTDKRGDTQIIEGGGRTLMPGLIDAHVHTMMESIALGVALTSDINYTTLVASKAAEKQLLRGFTTVRWIAQPRGEVVSLQLPARKQERIAGPCLADFLLIDGIPSKTLTLSQVRVRTSAAS